MPWQSVPLEESLPTCQRGDTFPVGEVKLLEKQTSPPDYLTEAELITLMEKHGIGGCTHPPTCPPGPRPEGSHPRTSTGGMLPELPSDPSMPSTWDGPRVWPAEPGRVEQAVPRQSTCQDLALPVKAEMCPMSLTPRMPNDLFTTQKSAPSPPESTQPTWLCPGIRRQGNQIHSHCFPVREAESPTRARASAPKPGFQVKTVARAVCRLRSVVADNNTSRRRGGLAQSLGLGL